MPGASPRIDFGVDGLAFAAKIVDRCLHCRFATGSATVPQPAQRGRFRLPNDGSTARSSERSILEVWQRRVPGRRLTA